MRKDQRLLGSGRLHTSFGNVLRFDHAVDRGDTVSVTGSHRRTYCLWAEHRYFDALIGMHESQPFSKTHGGMLGTA